ncbi:restriction endonuclease subunit S [Gordonia rhizosphera]|uniref:Type I restriction enzyme S protein n=1 Tax=Gordonia rhizosphera NBRC 16068 TaxID=1108045 RepID=K6V949_9ACTN|nr:restriction endonuclease subunit S [Gordonia rhizosphera]GAB92748.1 type I restriction enzyme S protein [Gordonia rhizosphera NBRC 16068]
MIPLGDLLYEFKDRPKPGESEPEVLTLTERNGFVAQRDRFSKRLAVENTSKYKLIGMFDIAFNPYLLWAGAIAQNRHWHKAIISPLYPTFRTREAVDPNYLIRLLLTEDMIARYDTIAYGSVPRKRRTSVDDFLALQVPDLPPLLEQRRIAAILDHADTLRTKRRETTVGLNELSEAIFVEMFDRDIESGDYILLGEALSSIDSGRSPKCQSRQASDGEYGVLKLSAVTTGTYLPGENKALPLHESADASNEVRVGDILFTRKNTRDLVAASAYVQSTPARMLLPDLIFRLNLRDHVGLDARYVQRALMYPLIRAKIQRLAVGSAGSMPNVSKAKLATVAIPRPSMDKQREFRRRIEKVEDQRAQQLDSEKALDTLFTSLQSRAFRSAL